MQNDERIPMLMLVLVLLLMFWLIQTGRWDKLKLLILLPTENFAGDNSIRFDPGAAGQTENHGGLTTAVGNSLAGDGSAIGGIIGSVVPGLGTTVGGIIGGLFGGLF